MLLCQQDLCGLQVIFQGSLTTLIREGVKIISQTENVVKEITVHVISVLVAD